MNYQEIIKNNFFADPFNTGYGTLPPLVEDYVKTLKVKPYAGERPGWYPNTETVREYLMEHYWGADYQSRSLKWVIGHNGTPLSQDSIQIDHIVPWNKISEGLKGQFMGKNAKGTPFDQLTLLPHTNGKLLKGIDYIDHPDTVDVLGPDVHYCLTNVAAIKYFHTIENLRPLPGSINARRNNNWLADEDLNIVNPEFIDYELMKKLAQLAASIEEYTSQVVHGVKEFKELNDRQTFIDKSIENTEDIILQLNQFNRSSFD